MDSLSSELLPNVVSPDICLADIVKTASILRTSARIAVALANGNGCLVSLSIVDREEGQRIQIGSSPCRIQEPFELIRVYVNVPSLIAVRSMLIAPLRKEIEPFIIGVGEVRTHDFAEGFVLCQV